VLAKNYPEEKLGNELTANSSIFSFLGKGNTIKKKQPKEREKRETAKKINLLGQNSSE